MTFFNSFVKLPEGKVEGVKAHPNFIQVSTPVWSLLFSPYVDGSLVKESPLTARRLILRKRPPNHAVMTCGWKSKGECFTGADPPAWFGAPKKGSIAIKCDCIVPIHALYLVYWNLVSISHLYRWFTYHVLRLNVIDMDFSNSMVVTTGTLLGINIIG